MKSTTIGLDIARNVFQAHRVPPRGGCEGYRGAMQGAQATAGVGVFREPGA